MKIVMMIWGRCLTCIELIVADLAEEDRKRLDEVFVQAPGGTVAPRAWDGWKGGRELEERKRQRGQEEVRHV